MAARGVSLKLRLGLGAAGLGIAAVMAAVILYAGMNRVAERLDAALAAEARTTRYAQLSTQVSTFIVVAAEAIQTGLPARSRRDRIQPVSDQIRRTFVLLNAGVESAVADARVLGIDAQSRYGTQSLGLARMAALLESTLDGLGQDSAEREQLRAYLDRFATAFDPLLNEAVNTELLFRNEILADIDRLRHALSVTALVIALLAILLVAAFYLGLIRPQFHRLDRLRQAARQIGEEDFAVALPATRTDEIGQLYAETNRMAAALTHRKQAVDAEWGRLNETIDQRTEELRTANARLAEIDENRRRFFADISHELRTPLTVILTEAQIGRAAGGESADAFTTIEARAGRLSRRIDDLLRVARSETGQLALDPVPADLADIALEAVAETRAELANAGMELTKAFHGPLPVRCDRNWLRQVIAGIIRNAIRHARDGGRLAIVASIENGMAVIAIEDAGPGIAPADQARVFERFTQAGGNAQGFGLGLGLARWVVAEQGGEIALQSPLKGARGTRIRVRLPLVTD